MTFTPILKTWNCKRLSKTLMGSPSIVQRRFAATERKPGNGVMATNEPTRIACGAPDFIITRKIFLSPDILKQKTLELT